jgi:hypothetical protein
MVTRRKVRSALSWLGIAAGALGLLIYILSPFLIIQTIGPFREIEIGRGAIRIAWHPFRSNWVPIPGAPPLQADPVTGVPIGLTPGQRFQYIERQAFELMPVSSARVWKFAAPQRDQRWHFRPQFAPSDAHRGAAIIPAWILVLIGAWSIYRRLPPDIRPGFCPRCEFDLRASPNLPGRPGRVRCPECGAIARGIPPAPPPPQPPAH